MTRRLPPILVLCLALGASATTLLQLSTGDLFRLASTVAVVEIGATRVVEGHGKLSTFAEAVVTRSFKGAPVGTTLQVVVPGGERGDWVQWVPGTPSLREGSSAVVFLEPAGAGALQFVGLEQGFVEIVPSKEQTGLVLQRRVTATVVPHGPPDPLATETSLGAYFEALQGLARGSR